MSSAVSETWVTVTKPKKTKTKTHNTHRPRFDFGTENETSKPKSVFLKPKSPLSKSNVVTWASVVKKTPKKSNQSSVKKTYLYDHEADALLLTMKWGDFDIMMEDVIIVPDGQPKPQTKK